MLAMLWKLYKYLTSKGYTDLRATAALKICEHMHYKFDAHYNRQHTPTHIQREREREGGRGNCAQYAQPPWVFLPLV